MFSYAVGREKHCKQISLACVGSVHSVSATLGLPPLMTCVLSQSTLLRLQVVLQGNCLIRALGCVHFPGLSCSGSGSQVLHKGTDSVGPSFYAFPRLEQLRQPGALQAHTPQVWCILSLSPSDHLGFLSSQWEHRLRCAVCLFWVSDLWLQPS